MIPQPLSYRSPIEAGNLRLTDGQRSVLFCSDGGRRKYAVYKCLGPELGYGRAELAPVERKLKEALVLTTRHLVLLGTPVRCKNRAASLFLPSSLLLYLLMVVPSLSWQTIACFTKETQQKRVLLLVFV